MLLAAPAASPADSKQQLQTLEATTSDITIATTARQTGLATADPIMIIATATASIALGELQRLLLDGEIPAQVEASTCSTAAELQESSPIQVCVFTLE